MRTEQKKLTATQVLKKYKGKFIDIEPCPFWEKDNKGNSLYEVRRVFTTCHENTTKILNINFVNHLYEIDYE